jgi:hypothetical protein
MTLGPISKFACWACCGVVAGLSVTSVSAEERRPDRDQLPRPVYKAERLESPAEQTVNPKQVVAPNQANPGEHPLAPAITLARTALAQMDANVKDYSATLIKRERIGDKLNEHEYMFIKVRQQPFSVYTYFLGPDRLKGQEAIYIEGQNDGNIVGHGVGIRKIAGTVRLKPTSMLAMQGQRYPITEIGLKNLTTKLVEIAEADSKYGECEVKFFPGAKINGRTCTCIQVTHPIPRKNFLFNMARVFYDDELNMITRYEAYDWPAEQGGQPLLSEEYTYLNLKINNGFTDADFNPDNPAYGYR